MQIRFFTRHDFKGWRRLIWWPVSVIQGKYVHCEVEVDGVVVNADNRRGVEIKQPIDMTPSSVIYIEHEADQYHKAVQGVMGQQYSWSGFFRLLLPKWGNDPKGMICSELVAFLLSKSAASVEYRVPFIAVPSHRWTPNAVHDALIRLKDRL